MEIQWHEVRGVNLSVRKMKKRMINGILKKVRPLMWESGFVKGHIGQSTPLKIFMFAPCLKDSNKYYKISENLEISGFTEEGAVITDAYMGLATNGLNGLSFEELLALWTFVKNDRYNLFVKNEGKNH